MSDDVKELQRQLAEFRAVFDAGPMMLWYKDLEGRHILVNRAAAMLEGLPVTAIEDKTPWDLYPPEQAAAYQADDAIVIQSGQPRTDIIEQHTSPATGELMWLKVSKIPARDVSGKITGVIVFAIDITEQKRLEERLNKLADDLKSYLQGNASRDEMLAYLANVKASVK